MIEKVVGLQQKILRINCQPSVRRMESQKISYEEWWKSLNNLDRMLVYYIANIDKCTPRLLSELTGKSRPTITAHLKNLLDLELIVEHSTSPRDPTKYYSIQ